MTVSALKKEFADSLKTLYPSEEILSFFAILSEFYLNFSRIDTVLKGDTELSEKQLNNFTEAILRIENNEPIQYIIGQTEFYGLNFNVNEHVLIPRPETEELVDWIIKDAVNKGHISILDIGTGSGCIPISIANSLDCASISAIDISVKALEVAKENAQLNKLNVTFIEKDILASEQLDQNYDVIVSNPPYIRRSEAILMEDNVLKHEPDIALFVENNDPLLFYKKISKLGMEYLNSNGSLYFEINEQLGEDLKTLLKSDGYKNIELKKDIFGKDRMIKAIKND